MKSIKKINKIANKILRNTSLKFEEILKNLTFKCTLLSIFKIEKKINLSRLSSLKTPSQVFEFE